MRKLPLEAIYEVCGLTPSFTALPLASPVVDGRTGISGGAKPQIALHLFFRVQPFIATRCRFYKFVSHMRGGAAWQSRVHAEKRLR